jgi:hypothetical protein
MTIVKDLRDYILESKNKDDFYNVKSTTDKYYKAIRKQYDGCYVVSFDLLEDNGWWEPDAKLTPAQRKDLSWLSYSGLEGINNRKNPITGKPMGVTVNNTLPVDDGIALDINLQYVGEDTSESIAACIDYIIGVLIEKVPSKRKKDYKGILKDVRKQLLKDYNDIPEPLSKADREKLHQMLSQDPLNIMVKNFNEFINEGRKSEDAGHEMAEYHIQWVAYKNANQKDPYYDEGFDSRKQALRWLKEMGYENTGRVACCAYCEYDGGATDYAYAENERSAIKLLAKYAAEYGVTIYDPFKVK